MFQYYSLGDSSLTALLGYAVVFFGLVLLLAVIFFMGKIMVAGRKEQSAEPAAPAAEKPLAPGSAGEIKLHDVPERDAAMAMAIVANQLGKPLCELRFRSIKEVKEDEV